MGPTETLSTGANVATSFVEDQKNVQNNTENMQKTAHAQRQSMKINSYQGLAQNMQNKFSEMSGKQVEVLTGSG